jgi:hypothetical protein
MAARFRIGADGNQNPSRIPEQEEEMLESAPETPVTPGEDPGAPAEGDEPAGPPPEGEPGEPGGEPGEGGEEAPTG